MVEYVLRIDISAALGRTKFQKYCIWNNDSGNKEAKPVHMHIAADALSMCLKIGVEGNPRHTWVDTNRMCFLSVPQYGISSALSMFLTNYHTSYTSIHVDLHR